MTLVSDLADRGEHIDIDSAPNCHLEVNVEEQQAIIVWTENLRFHAELAQSDEERFAASSIGTLNRWAELTEGGWLKAGAEAALGEELARILVEKAGLSAEFVQSVHDKRGSAVEVWTADTGSDEPCVTFEIVTGYEDGETYEAWLERVGWPVRATLINCTDPGTFMFPYLFSRILYHPIAQEV
ncbi:hypothetical protein JRC04_05040 [Mycolicibacterium sp. S2-37]|uniref:hypothetical protein n=1 Tax=Mycolicibacterium sp. S2-37 TaxID=2810297 RepID=UPI001A952FC5|nr:hypothetical protein [Mycolicibacterium sp. S2-37]MBO0676823.1 hypothetical protein [Mycolicibacterium sp. S2-37]